MRKVARCSLLVLLLAACLSVPTKRYFEIVAVGKIPSTQELKKLLGGAG